MGQSPVSFRLTPLFLIVIFVGLIGWMVAKHIRPVANVEKTAIPVHGAMSSTSTDAATVANGVTPKTSPRRSLALAKQLNLMIDPVKAKQQRDLELAALEAQHRAESVDSAWASKAEQALSLTATSDVMASTRITPQGYTADCRAATCRISASFASSSDAQDWGTFFLTSSGAQIRQAKLMVVPGPNGTSEVRIFGALR